MPNLIIKIPATEIIIPYDELNFKVLEEKIMEVLKKTGKRVLEEVIKAVDEISCRNRDKSLKIKGKAKKYISTVFGEIQFIRRRYWDKVKKITRYLADEKLGIRKGIETSPMREMLESELAVVCDSYRKASKLIVKYFLGGRSHESVRQVVLREGSAMREHQEAEIENIRVEASKGELHPENNAPEVVYVEVDGTGLKMQKSRTGKRGSRRGREVKLGIVYSGRERRYTGGNGKQKKLKNKYVYASLEKADWFMEKFSLICEKVLNISESRIKLFGGDGAEWINNGIKSCFYGFIYELCRFHLNRAIKRAFGYSKEMEKKLKGYLKLDKIDEGIKFIDKIINMTGEKKKKRIKKLKDLKKYIDNNRDGINAIRRLKKKLSSKDRKLICNLGAIESNIFNAVTQRMKKRRQSWSEAGAESMLQMICRMINYGGMESWYSKERYEKIEIKEEDYSRLVANAVWADRREGGIAPARMPVLTGPHQDKGWAGVLRKMNDAVVVCQDNDVEESDLEPEVVIN